MLEIYLGRVGSSVLFPPLACGLKKPCYVLTDSQEERTAYCYPVISNVLPVGTTVPAKVSVCLLVETNNWNRGILKKSRRRHLSLQGLLIWN